MSLNDRIAVVTGGAGYIGSTTARRLASEGATVVVSDVNRELAAEVADAIVAEDGSATAIETDVTSTRSIETMVAQTIQQHGRIDVLVNVAGGSARKLPPPSTAPARRSSGRSSKSTCWAQSSAAARS